MSAQPSSQPPTSAGQSSAAAAAASSFGSGAAPHASPTFSHLPVDALFASPAIQPLHSHTNHANSMPPPTSSTVAASSVSASSSSSSSNSHTVPSSSPSSSSSSDFAHPASSLTAASPLTAPVNAMGFMRSMNRTTHHHPTPSSAASTLMPAPAAPSSGSKSASASASRRNSIVDQEHKGSAAYGGAIGVNSFLRSSTTSPNIPSRSIISSKSPHPSSLYPPSPMTSPAASFMSGGVEGLLDTPLALGSVHPHLPTSGSKARYTHGLSKPFESSPFIHGSSAASSASRLRSPRGGPSGVGVGSSLSLSHTTSPMSTNLAPLMSMSPSPAMGAMAMGMGMGMGMGSILSQTHSPNISFALPSPSLMPAPVSVLGGGSALHTRSSVSASASMREHGLSGALHMPHHNHHHPHPHTHSHPHGGGGGGGSTGLQSHIFGSFGATTAWAERDEHATPTTTSGAMGSATGTGTGAASKQQSLSLSKSPRPPLRHDSITNTSSTTTTTTNRPSSSLGMFSPNTHSSSRTLHDPTMPGLISGSATPSLSAANTPHVGALPAAGQRTPSSSSMNMNMAIPSSPNLSILGKLRSLHATTSSGGDLADNDNLAAANRSMSPPMKLEAAAATFQHPTSMGHSLLQHHHGTTTTTSAQANLLLKRNRNEYESVPVPVPSASSATSSTTTAAAQHQQQQQGNNGYAPMPSLTSPTMVGSLPPHHTQHQHLGMGESAVAPSPAFTSRQSSHEFAQPLPSKRAPKPSQKLLQSKQQEAEENAHAHAHAQAQHSISHHHHHRSLRQRTSIKREPEEYKDSDDAGGTGGAGGGGGNGEDGEVDNENVIDSTAIAGNGSGSSCHQCKSRRLLVDLIFCCNMTLKGNKKKLAPTATSSALHSCRKKYCGTCFDESTQILTSSGFLFLDELLEHEAAGSMPLIAAYDDESRQIEYHPIAGHVLVFDGEHRMIDIRQHKDQDHTNDSDDEDVLNSGDSMMMDDQISVSVTHDHDMFVAFGEREYDDDGDDSVHHWTTPFHKTKAAALLSDDPKHLVKFMSRAADGLNVQHGFHPVSSAADSTLPFVDALNLTHSEQVDAMLELVGHWLAHGGFILHRPTSSDDSTLPSPSSQLALLFTQPTIRHSKQHSHSHSTLSELLKRASLIEGLDYEQYEEKQQCGDDMMTHCDGDETRRCNNYFKVFNKRWVDFFTKEYPSSASFQTTTTTVMSVQTDAMQLVSPSPLLCKSQTLQPSAVTASLQPVAHTRFFSWIHALQPKQLRCLLHGMSSPIQPIAPDDDEALREICTTSIEFREQILIACLHAGYTAHFTRLHASDLKQRYPSSILPPSAESVWSVRFTDSLPSAEPILQPHRDVRARSFVGRVWCVTVPPLHRIIVRRALTTTSESDLQLTHSTSPSFSPFSTSQRRKVRFVHRASRPLIIGQCLQKFYNEKPPAKRHSANTTWPCPACRGICCCAACRRIKARQLGEIDPTSLSPASMLAYSYVYAPEILLSSMGDASDFVDFQQEQQHMRAQKAAQKAAAQQANYQAAMGHHGAAAAAAHAHAQASASAAARDQRTPSLSSSSAPSRHTPTGGKVPMGGKGGKGYMGGGKGGKGRYGGGGGKHHHAMAMHYNHEEEETNEESDEEEDESNESEEEDDTFATSDQEE